MKIKRRAFLRRSLAAATISGLIGPSSAKSALTATFMSPVRDDHPLSVTARYELRDNLSAISNGEFGVELLSGLSGGRLLGQVGHGVINMGVVSSANLARLAPVIDALNIPFWAADNQRFFNLVNSPTWKRAIDDALAQSDVEVLYWGVRGARTIATLRRSESAIVMPEDMRQRVVRVPPSPILREFYAAYGAKPRQIEWGKVIEAARNGGFDVMDPSIIGLLAAANGIADEIKMTTLLQSFPDGFVVIANRAWARSLGPKRREQLYEAASRTVEEQRAIAWRAEGLAREFARDRGISVRVLNPEERSAWVAVAGHENDRWRSWKEQLVGSTARFDQFVAAAEND